VDLPRNKHVGIALTYIYGIGQPRARRILTASNVDPEKKVQDLGEDEVNRIRQTIESEGSVEGDLRKDTSMHIKRLIEIGSYRGYRHRRNLPVRGQRTHTNARTRKGPRKGTIAQKKKSTAKT
jgi:small subunit ribosomal protein S13